MTKVKDIIRFMDKEFPKELSQKWDVTQGLIGNSEVELKKGYISA